MSLDQGDAMPYNILVVDDDKNTANYLADLLRLLGHTVDVALGPRGALYKLNQSIPDILCLDVNMPGVDGLEICRYIRRDPRTGNMPIIIISANDEKAHKDAAFMAGASYYIVKPAMIEDLEVALAHVMKSPQPPRR
ncbi:MAG: response regulator [Anaerolineae bacterium]|nr:response regulator [Anaerolineae bacterium]